MKAGLYQVKRKLLGAVIWIMLVSLFGAGCGQLPESSIRHEVPGGDPKRGLQALQDYGCISCHTIPGVPRSEALVGPPLIHWSDRRYIAGQFPNTPENLIAWIMAPQSMIPGSAMPDVGVREQDARDMSAYLYTLRRDR